jgi:hypothetical protein
MDRQTDRKVNGKSDGMTDRRTDRLTHRRTDRNTDGRTDRQRNRHTDGTDRQMEQTDRLTDGETGLTDLTDQHMNTQKDKWVGGKAGGLADRRTGGGGEVKQTDEETGRLEGCHIPVVTVINNLRS